ncbi:inhibin beta chain-like, partial [Drosophila busckii]|uniref:inhibin beta chain-like n=1 Tax=Drosophila busckii TaxID=30019 RepID=UPI00083F48CC
NNINNNENSHGYIIQNRTSFTARRSQYHSKTDQRLFISQEKDHGTDSSIFLNPNRLTRLATLRSTKKHKSNNYKKKKKGDNIRKKNKSNLNAYSKSTYLIDINRSKDSSYKNTIGGNNEHNNRVYYNDYSAIRYLQNNKGGNKEYKPLIYDTFTTADQERNGFEREEFFGNTKEIITFAEEGIQYRPYRIVEFAPQKTRVPNQKLSIRSAQMHIRIEKGANAESEANLQIDRLIDEKRKSRMDLTRHRIKIWVFRMTGAVNITEKEIDQDFLFRASFDVDTDNLGWQKFDLTETIREWYSDSTGENLRLLIDCTGCGSQYSLHLFQLSAQTPYAQLNTAAFPNPNRPFLVLHTESSRPRRVRRRAVDCGGAISGQCCKESFYVSFKALGWDDWIIAPRGYFANYCRGECSGPFRTPDTFQTFHAHFIEEYRKMGLLNGMKPCCAPIKFSSMSLIYYGDDGIIKRDLPKMVIDECGCP